MQILLSNYFHILERDSPWNSFPRRDKFYLLHAIFYVAFHLQSSGLSVPDLKTERFYMQPRNVLQISTYFSKPMLDTEELFSTSGIYCIDSCNVWCIWIHSFKTKFHITKSILEEESSCLKLKMKQQMEGRTQSRQGWLLIFLCCRTHQQCM